MAWELFIAAIGLVLVFEGILPFVCPDCWRRMAKQLSEQSNRSFRIFGLVSMLIGLLLVYFSF